MFSILFDHTAGRAPQKGRLKRCGCEEPVVEIVTRDQREKTGKPEGRRESGQQTVWISGGGNEGKLAFPPTSSPACRPLFTRRSDALCRFQSRITWLGKFQPFANREL